MKPISARIDDLRKEVDNLTTLREEAKSEWLRYAEESIYYRNKSVAAEMRMLNLINEIEYRLTEIAELEESANGQIQPGAC
ncbi:hypothetical protein [Brevibacillus borstelensis]|uniref:hypothetical protein n=1 Tax=Brevibacillus borstelensis TaxID=45462 RepID=UPI0004F38B20|nr:hypothetical protein [Brevibacillus borstelensis]KKX54446.1 hypothetical protein X546_15595 [Brevibacillus borstelensis cifa_chp40]